jgi:NAD(P)-dependent dehydrogenase (short-subunit alcohol dehydrogenase family)
MITGASSGFGQAIAREVTSRGGSLIATARERATLEALRSAAPDRVLASRVDVTKAEQVAAAVQDALARFGRIDVLVNNAGYGLLSGAEEASDAELRALFEVNFFGLATVTRAVLPVMRRQRSGLIINISSTAGVFGVAGAAYYCASKFAVEGFSESLAQEVAPFGIRTLIVEPGAYRTEFFGRSLARPAQPRADYPDLAAMRAEVDRMDKAQLGDPELAAKIIVMTARGAELPRRLIIGPGAVERVRQTLQSRLDELADSMDGERIDEALR